MLQKEVLLSKEPGRANIQLDPNTYQGPIKDNYEGQQFLLETYMATSRHREG